VKQGEKSKPSQEQTFGMTLREKWLNPRRKRFWAIFAVLVYTVAGFFLVPLLIKNGIINSVRDDLGREARIGKTAVNPYLLTLRIQDFELDDRDSVKLVGFDEFLVDFELSSLLHWAWTFREINLTGSYFYFERFDPDDSRLSRLLADASANQPADPASEEKGLPRLLIKSIRISDGSGDLVDNVPSTPVDTHLGPINIEIHELSTLPDLSGNQSVTIALENGETLSWRGSLALSPFVSAGELVLSGSRLDKTTAYLKAILPLDTMSASLSARFDYRIQLGLEGEPDIDIDNMQVELTDLSVAGLDPTTRFLEIASASLDGGTLRYPEQTLQFRNLKIVEPKLVSWLDQSGELSLSQLVMESVSKPTGGADTADSGQWAAGINRVTIEQGAIGFTDHGVQPPAAMNIQDLQLTIDEISNQQGGAFPINLTGGLMEGGSFGLEGSLSLIPELKLTARAHSRGLPLSLGQPYAQKYARILINQGTFDSNLDISLEHGDQIKLGGAINIPGLAVVDSIENKPLIGWKSLEIDQFDLETVSQSLHLSRVIFEQPFMRLVINEDRTTNLNGLLIESDDAAAKSDQSDNTFSVIVGGMAIGQGAMDFADLSLPLPFATTITDLDGTISTISTDSIEPSSIRLEGQVDEYGLARIEGTMNILDPIQHTDVSVEFRNLLMSRLSPYTVQFAGQEIDEGKLDLDLGYFIDKGQLNGQNDIVLSDLVLGEKVDHPDAASLPLGLAVALLKDADGVIDIDLPVEGDINDPEFRIGGVVWQAITGLITKVVSAPFRLLGSLIGIDAEDLGQFQFLAGRSDLTPPELEKIAQLEEALRQRPELTVEITGATDPQIDAPALQYQRLRQAVLDRLGEDAVKEVDENLMLDVEVRQIFESLFIERFPDVSLETLKAEYTAPPANDAGARPELDELAYSAGLRDRLLASEVISPEDLEALAAERAEAIRTAFLAGGQFDENRVVVATAVEVESEDGEWVVMELGVAAD
jgi:hypothetical protein